MNAANLTPPGSAKWLLKREFWEHKGSMFWAPVIVAAILVIGLGALLSYGLAAHGLPMRINGVHVSGNAMLRAIPSDQLDMMVNIAAGTYLMAALPLVPLLTVVVTFYCLGALYDERRDRSILFWKSLPVSDGMTVLSKAATATLVAPLLVAAAACVASLALLLIVCVALSLEGVSVFGRLLSSPDLYLSPLRLLAMLPVYVVWMLPSVGWLLLVSSWARTKPILWAAGVPLVSLAIVKWISVAMAQMSGAELAIMPDVQAAVARLLGGVVPGMWLSFHPELLGRINLHHGLPLNDVVVASYRSLAGIDAWIGAALGAAMLFGAARLRRWRDEG
jgi:ABC-2 type transport system permease protein